MTTTVTLTGTGTPHPSATRACAGCLVRHGDVAVQVDAGRGTTMRLAALGLRAADLSAVLLTHHHSDHLLDLDDLVLSRWIQGLQADDPLPVVAPAGPAATFAERVVDAWADDVDVRVEHLAGSGRPRVAVTAFTAVGDAPIEVWAGGGVRVTAARVRHEPVEPAVGYRFETPDGVIAVSGDTRVCEEVEALVAGADVVVHEAVRATALAPVVAGTPYETIFRYHADTVELGAMAERAGVRHLVLTHLIPEPADDTAAKGFHDDVREGGFTGELTVGNDLDTVTLP